MDVLRKSDSPFQPETSSQRHVELRDLEIDREKSKRISGGSNTVLLVHLRGDGNGVFKPGRGEDPLEIPESRYKLYKREVAAYNVARFLHPNLVPVTTIRSVDGQEGSIQDFIPDPKKLIWEVGDLNALIRDQLFGLSIFDYAIWNKDRKAANFFIKDSSIIAIDNGLSFDNWWQYNITENLQEYAQGRPAPLPVSETYATFMTSRQEQDDLRESVINLVPKRTVDALFARISAINQLFKKGRIYNSDIENLEYHPL